MSASDIEKGAMWRNEIARQLEVTEVGILCLTPDNLERPWLLFEAGAISKKLGYVCTYLLNIEPSDVKEPLAQFQATKATATDTLKLLQTINRAQNDGALSQDRIERAFDKWWPDLDLQLKQIVGTEEKRESRREERELIEEILLAVRYLVQKGQTQTSVWTEDDSNVLIMEHGEEVKAIRAELVRLRKNLLVAALEDARVEYRNGNLIAVFASENAFARRLRESRSLIQEIGQRLFGHPISLEVKVGKRLSQPVEQDAPIGGVQDDDIPF
jgi:hypothetical protein